MIPPRPTAVDDGIAMFLEVVEQLSEQRVAPRAPDMDAAGRLDPAVVALLCDSELLVAGMPLEAGGGGGGALVAALVVERLAAASAAVATLPAQAHVAGAAAVAAGQADRWIEPLRAGRLLAPAIPTAGTRITAELAGDGWILEGRAPRVEHADRAQSLLVLASDGDEPAAFVVPPGAESLRWGPDQVRTGLRGVTTRELQLQQVRVPRSARLGGAETVHAARNLHWITTAAMACGIARGAVEQATAYLHEREQFGRPLADFAALRQMLAAMTARTQGAAALAMQAAVRPDATSPAAAADCAAAAALATEAAVEVTIDAVQLHGGYGWMKEYATERMMRDAASVRARTGGRRAALGPVAAQALEPAGR
jgi:alkylation response protein AidB-like acyl-CoA dehydrogenase